MKKCAIYVRVSTIDQAEEGYSIGEQTAKLKAYCKAMDWAIADVYTDPGFSGAKLDRPELQRLIKDIEKSKFDTVLIYKLDRLSRSVRDTLYLVQDVFTKNNVDFISLNENIDTSSAMGGLFLTILSAISEFERETIKERMMLGKKGRARSGKTMSYSRLPFGYDYNKSTEHLDINPVQAPILISMFENYLSGMSLNQLKKHLNANGHIGRKTQWTLKGIDYCLKNPVYIGKQRFSGEIYDLDNDPLISTELFEQVQEQLKIRHDKAYEEKNMSRPFQSKYMLSGLLKCGYCGASLSIMSGKKRANGEFSPCRYQCLFRRHGGGSKHKNFSEETACDSGYYYMPDLEEVVLKKIEKLQEDKEYLESICNPTQNHIIDTRSIRNELDLILSKISRVNELYIEGAISKDVHHEKVDNMMKQKSALEAQLSNDDSNSKIIKLNSLHKILESDNILDLSYEKQKFMVKSLVEKVEVTAEEILIHFNF